jgi:hypothetical protein
MILNVTNPKEHTHTHTHTRKSYQSYWINSVKLQYTGLTNNINCILAEINPKKRIKKKISFAMTSKRTEYLVLDLVKEVQNLYTEN